MTSPEGKRARRISLAVGGVVMLGGMVTMAVSASAADARPDRSPPSAHTVVSVPGANPNGGGQDPSGAPGHTGPSVPPPGARPQPEPPPPGYVSVMCTDTGWLWDDRHPINVPADTPDWWRHEVEVDEEGCDLAKHPPQLACQARQPDARHSSGLLPDECWGTYPTPNYELTWQDGAWYDVGQLNDKLAGWLTGLLFAIGRSAIQIVLWILAWGFTFDVKEYTQLTREIGDRYQLHIIRPFNLEDIFWFILVGWLGYTSLKGKVGVVTGELLLTILLAGMGTVLLHDRVHYMNAVANFMDTATADMLTAARGEDPPDNPSADSLERVRAEIRPLQQTIHEQFVENPYMYLNWGTPLQGQCRDVQNNILSVGWYHEGWTSRYMARAGSGCRKAADFNASPGNARLVGAALSCAVSLLLASFLGLGALSIVIAKFLLAVLFAVLPFIVPTAILPGSGRRLAWSSVGAGCQLVIVVVGTSGLVALLMLPVQEVARHENLGLIERWGLVLLIVSTVYFSRRKLLSGGQTFATRIADSLTRMSPATANWAGGGSIGFDMDRPDRAAWRGIQGGALLGGVAAGALAVRMRERRSARRSYRNAERLERSRERPMHEFRHDTYLYGGRRPGRGPVIEANALASGGRGGGGGGGGVLVAGRGPMGSRPALPAARRGHRGPPATRGPAGRRTADHGGGVGFAAGGAGGGYGEGGYGGANVRVTMPGGGNGQDGEWRVRHQVSQRIRTPRPFMRHPFGHVFDRIVQNMPYVGTKGQLWREVRAARGERRWRDGPSSQGTRWNARGWW